MRSRAAADCFKGAFRCGAWTPENLPTVHCYSFLRSSETLADLKLRAEGHLGGPIPDDAWRVVIVRDVAPNKARLGTRGGWASGFVCARSRLRCGWR